MRSDWRNGWQWAEWKVVLCVSNEHEQFIYMRWPWPKCLLCVFRSIFFCVCDRLLSAAIVSTLILRRARSMVVVCYLFKCCGHLDTFFWVIKFSLVYAMGATGKGLRAHNRPLSIAICRRTMFPHNNSHWIECVRYAANGLNGLRWRRMWTHSFGWRDFMWPYSGFKVDVTATLDNIKRIIECSQRSFCRAK